MTLDIVLVTALVVAALATVMTARLLASAIGLAVTSAVLAVIMFRLDSSIAAVFELSVCAGLIPVIFISVIGLTDRLSREAVVERRKERFKRFWLLPVIVVVAAVALSQVSLPLSLPTLPDEAGDVRQILWNVRHVDLIGQIVILLGAAFGVAILLKESKND